MLESAIKRNRFIFVFLSLSLIFSRDHVFSVISYLLSLFRLFFFCLYALFLPPFFLLSVHLRYAKLRVCMRASGCSQKWRSEDVSEEKVGGKNRSATAFFVLTLRFHLHNLGGLRRMLSNNLDDSVVSVVRFYEGGVDLAPLRISPCYPLFP